MEHDCKEIHSILITLYDFRNLASYHSFVQNLLERLFRVAVDLRHGSSKKSIPYRKSNVVFPFFKGKRLTANHGRLHQTHGKDTNAEG